MKAAVIEIGSYQLLCPSVQVATKLVELLGKIAVVTRKYDSDQHRYLYEIPDNEDYRRLDIEMRLIDASDVKKPVPRVPKTHRLGCVESLPPAP